METCPTCGYDKAHAVASRAGEQEAWGEALLAAQKRADTYEEALFECARWSGADTSGGTPTDPPLDVWAIRCVRELRAEYDALT